MALTINTNIMALNTQNQLSKSSSMMATSMERLSSGLRINSAKDDAAGLAIADRFTTQINGLNQAIRNANDGISLSQTAEGAMSEMSNILQRMRELAVQSINDTNTASDRLAIQSEVDQLYDELDRIANTTQFNGQNVLDGTLQSSTFQIGANAGQTLNVNLNSVTVETMGLNGFTAIGELNSGRTYSDVGGTDLTIAAGDVLINGESAFADDLDIYARDVYGTAPTDADVGGDSAYLIAEAINFNSGVTGATASAYNEVTTGPLTEGITYYATVNGTYVTATSAESLADVINRDVSGLEAAVNSDGTLTLTNQTGRDIIIADVDPSGDDTWFNTDGASTDNIAANIGVTAGVYAGYVSLTSVDGSELSVEVGTGGANTDVQALGFNVSYGSDDVVGANVTTNALTEAMDIEINGVQVGATDGASAADKAGAINEISDQTGVTATAFTEIELTLDFTVTLGDMEVNGTVVDVSGAVNLDDVVDAINTAGIQGIVASAKTSGELVLTSNTGLDITVKDDSGTANFITGAEDSYTATADPDETTGLTFTGALTLTNASGGDITLGGDDIAELGLVSQGGGANAIGSGLSVTTANNAAVALGRIDDALEILNNARSELGAVQNRFESTISNLSNVAQNLTAARGRILDADFAAETTNLSKAQILQQAGTAMLAQANASQQNVLSLLG